MKAIVSVVGVIGVLLGGLWLFQGLGLVQIRPILCFADCAPVQAPSWTWVIIGTLVALAGGFAICHAIARRSGGKGP